MERSIEQLVDEVTDRLRYYPADTPDKRRQHEIVRLLTWTYLTELIELIPDCRELSIALNLGESVQLWANKALARHGAREGGAIRAGQETVARVIDFLEYDRVPSQLLGPSKGLFPEGGNDAD